MPPRRVPHGYLDSPVPIALAHRGGALMPGNERVENTMAAFARAVELGYRYVETDVHASRDGVVYAFHDLDLGRMAEMTDAIGQLGSSQVDEVRLAGTEPIPRLADVLTTFPELRLNIDVKADQALEPTARVLEEHDAVDRVCLASFSDDRMRRMRARLPAATTSLSPREVVLLRFGPLRVLQAAGRRAGGDCVQVPERRGRVTVVTPGFVRRAHRLGLPVHVWTVDDPDRMRYLLDMGVDGLVTDRPDVLKDVLVERGAWEA